MPKCKVEDYLCHEDEKHRTHQKVKRFHLPIREVIRRVGSSSGIIFKKSVLDYLGFKIGDRVYIYIEHREEDEGGEE